MAGARQAHSQWKDNVSETTVCWWTSQLFRTGSQPTVHSTSFISKASSKPKGGVIGTPTCTLMNRRCLPCLNFASDWAIKCTVTKNLLPPKPVLQDAFLNRERETERQRDRQTETERGAYRSPNRFLQVKITRLCLPPPPPPFYYFF